VTRGDVVWIELGSGRGSEATKRRPCIVVSNDANNRAASTVTVVPCTTNVHAVYPFEVYLEDVLGRPSKAQAQQVRTVDRRRIVTPAVARLGPILANRVDDALRLHLAL
jgi:mRNA interferase MazF